MFTRWVGDLQSPGLAADLPVHSTRGRTRTHKQITAHSRRPLYRNSRTLAERKLTMMPKFMILIKNIEGQEMIRLLYKTYDGFSRWLPVYRRRYKPYTITTYVNHGGLQWRPLKK